MNVSKLSETIKNAVLLKKGNNSKNKKRVLSPEGKND